MDVVNDEQKLEYIEKRIGVFPDFPKKGVVFRDIFTALTDAQCCVYLKDLLLKHVKTHCSDINIVVGLESRGFLFSFLLAAELGVGNVALRKKGKLPGDCFQQEYSLEYRNDVIEIQKAAIKPGQKVLIVDDLLATGGSLEAAISLVRKAGGIIADVLVIIELCDLNGRNRIDCNIHSLIQYD